MKGDFSRGHAPDRRRGERYRSVYQQQGRLLLDSDVNALADALGQGTREAVASLGCASGSPDLGWLVTPGRLLGVFRDAAGVVPIAGAPEIWCDHARLYGERFPGLRLAAPGGAATVRVPLRQLFDAAVSPGLALWAWADLPAAVTVNGVAVAIAPLSPNLWRRYVVDLGGATGIGALDIDLAANAEVWIGLIEQDQDTGPETNFWAAAGRHHAQGLMATLTADAAFPDAAFPDAAGFRVGSPPLLVPLGGLVPAGLAPGQILLAYLETWERGLHPAEAPGLLEQALGGQVDTTLRGAVVGQVKLARFDLPAAAAETEIRAALAAPVGSGGTLALGEAASSSDPDPCALPELEGYAGIENRLYRFEVHRGGGLGAVLIKWSRDNAGMLVAASADGAGNLLLPADSPLRNGDLVEVTSETVELGDAALGHLDAAGFQPPERAAGQLGLLTEVPGAATGNERGFRLVSPADEALPVPLDARYGDPARAGLRLRRWDGLLDPAAIAATSGLPLSAGPHPVEFGLEVTLGAASDYRNGAYWQFELRVSRQNVTGGAGAAPHGPERLFAPLALFRFAATDEPLELLRWIDERHPPLCDLTAADVAYDGGSAGSTAPNVQVALDRLFAQIAERGTCGEIAVGPTDDLQAAFDAIPAGADARICLHPGIRALNLPVTVAGKGHLLVSGAGAATRLVSATLDGMLSFANCASVTLRDFAVESRAAAGSTGVAQRDTLRIIDCAAVTLEHLQVQCGGAAARLMTAVYIATVAAGATPARVRVADCRVRVGNAQSGITVLNPASAVLRDTDVDVAATPVTVAELAADPRVAAAIGTVFLDRVFVGTPAGFDSEIFTGSSLVVFNTDPWGKPRMTTQLGGEVVLWSSHPSIPPEAWEDLLDANPRIGQTSDTFQPWWLHRSFRELRVRLARRAVGLPTSLTMPASAQASFNALGAAIVASSGTASGHRGITVGGQTGFPTPDVRIEGNRVTGFRQGIHAAAGTPDTNGAQAMRVWIDNNAIGMRVPLYAGERHGIFVGDAQSARVTGNRVELLPPTTGIADALSVPMEGIRVWGSYGTLMSVRDNAITGPRTGIRIVTMAAKPIAAAWVEAGNGFAGTGQTVVKPPTVT